MQNNTIKLLQDIAKAGRIDEFFNSENWCESLGVYLFREIRISREFLEIIKQSEGTILNGFEKEPAPFSEMVQVPKDVVRSTTVLGYFAVFYKLLPLYKTQKEAHEALEAAREAYGFPRRYASMKELTTTRSRLRAQGINLTTK